MNNDYTINDIYGYNKDISYLNNVIDETLKLENINNAIFSVILVSDEEIKKLNKEYRGIDRVTDVISFAFLDNEEEQEEVMMLGDIYVCIPKMISQAKEYGHSEKRELSFLVVHGLLHLLGYDHMKGKKEEEEMFAKQNIILDKLNIVR